MMHISLRTQIIIGAASLLCLILIGSAFILLREIGPSPASLLPSERTMMLVTNLSPDHQRQLQNILPALGDAPLQEQGTSVAALVRSGTTASWVVFDAKGKPSVKGSLMTEGERPLSSDNAYQELRSTYSPDAAWLFIRFPETKLQIEGVVNPSLPVAVTLGTGSLKLAWSTRMESAFTGPIPKHTNETILRVSAARLGPFLMNAAALLTEQNRIAAGTLLRSWISRTLGKDMSAAYDVLPLLDGAGTMIVAKTATGSLGTALRALPHDASEQSLKRMEKGILSSAVEAQHVQQTFDDQFTFDTMKIAESAAAEATKIGAWIVRLSPAANAMLGQDGLEWAFGTDLPLFTSLIRTMHSTAKQRIVDATMDPAAIDALLQRWQIRLAFPWQIVPGTGKAVVWSIERKGGLAIVTMGR